MSTIGNVAVREAPAAEVAVRRRINLIEGANVTITIVDDPVDHEIDITIAAVAAVSAGNLEQWFPASDPNNSKGTHPSMIMLDGEETIIRQSFYIPSGITTVDTAVVVVIPDGNGNLDWEADTNFGLLCAHEQYDANPDSTTGTTTVTDGEIECIDISAALTGATASDLVGIEFMRDGDDGADTVNADVHFIGIYVKGS